MIKEMIELENQLEEKLNISGVQYQEDNQINDLHLIQTFEILNNSSFEEFTLFPSRDHDDKILYAVADLGLVRNCSDEFPIVTEIEVKQNTPREITFNPDQNNCGVYINELTFGKPKVINIHKYKTMTPLKKSIQKIGLQKRKQSSLQ